MIQQGTKIKTKFGSVYTVLRVAGAGIHVYETNNIIHITNITWVGGK